MWETSLDRILSLILIDIDINSEAVSELLTASRPISYNSSVE